MLIDDNSDDNFIHGRIIKKLEAAEIVIIHTNAMEALEYLKSKNLDIESPLPPDLIFLDINMPQMNGWEFLKEYKKLDKEFQSQTLVVMLTNSNNPDDLAKAKIYDEICEFKTKPLTKEMMEEILENYFQH